MLYDLTHFPTCYRRSEAEQNKGFVSLDILLHQGSKDCYIDTQNYQKEQN